MSAPLEARGVTCTYDGRTALSGLDLVLEPGRFVALLGPNGAGKTTALRALARLHRPHLGTVRYRGVDVWKEPPRQHARRIGFVPQTDRAFGALTVEQVATLGRTPHRGWFLPFDGADRRQVAETLDRLGLLPLRHRSLETLSGGERRRALLARVLVQEAEVLLLDEPTAHLDLRHQIELLELLRELVGGRGIAVLASFHDLNHAAQHADEAAVLCAGRLLAHGPVADVLTPEVLHRAYGLTVEVTRQPGTGLPAVLPVRAQVASP